MPRSFGARVAAIAAAGLVVRLVHVLVFTRSLHDMGDSEFFHRLALLIGDGRGFINPIGLALTGQVTPTALHPPLYPLLLGAFSWAGIDSYLGQRVIGCFVGALVIAAVGVLARRVGGDRVGLIAAALAAAYPVFISSDGAVMSESLYGLFVALSLIAVYRLIERPSAARAAVVGVAIGLAALTRAEALALLPLALLPAGRRLQSAAVAVLACVLVLVPWTIRNWSAFDRPILISNNSGTLVSGANCARTYHGELTGSWEIFCVKPGTSTNEAVAAAHERRVGLDYARDHAGRVPVVLGVRVLRTFSLWQPVAEARRAESRAFGIEVAGFVCFYLLVPFGVYGVVVLRRRGVPVSPLLATLGLAVLVSVIGYGLPRFRQPFDVALVVLAAVAIEALVVKPPRAAPPAPAQPSPRPGTASASAPPAP